LVLLVVRPDMECAPDLGNPRNKLEKSHLNRFEQPICV
jgi:hypothetical protein